MSFREKLKSAARWTAAVTSAATMNATPIQAQQPDSNTQNLVSSAIRVSTKDLDQRVERGTVINGKTKAERSARWQTMKEEKGTYATLDAIRKEKIEKIEISRKDEKGYVFETYEPGKKHTFESYYPNGVLQSKTTGNGQEAEGYYPDGSRKFVRTVDGTETAYHPGGEKGKEKIKETPHQLYGSYDVLDAEGRRTEHHHAVTESQRQSPDGPYTARDVKKVDLYDPQTQEISGTYTLDHWGVSEGRIAQLGFRDDSGKMQTMDFPKARKIGDRDYYTSEMALDDIKEIYHEEKQERAKDQAQQKALFNRAAGR